MKQIHLSSMEENLRDWRHGRSVIRDGCDVRALASANGRSLSPEAEALLFPNDRDTPVEEGQQDTQTQLRDALDAGNE